MPLYVQEDKKQVAFLPHTQTRHAQLNRSMMMMMKIVFWTLVTVNCQGRIGRSNNNVDW